MAIFFLFPSKKFLPVSFKIQLLETSPQKQKEQRQKHLDVSFFWCLFPSCTFWIFSYCSHFAKFVCLLETAEIETGLTKSSWDQANIRQKLGLVWRNRKKISQIFKDYFYLPFFLLIILCCNPNQFKTNSHPPAIMERHLCLWARSPSVSLWRLISIPWLCPSRIGCARLLFSTTPLSQLQITTTLHHIMPFINTNLIYFPLFLFIFFSIFLSLSLSPSLLFYLFVCLIFFCSLIKFLFFSKCSFFWICTPLLFRFSLLSLKF